LKFEELSLHPHIVEALSQLNITDCTDIQRDTIPLILDSKDISGLSQTGTGKTFAFAIPLLERLLRTKDVATMDPLLEKRKFDGWNTGNFILVLVPTRELADQINKSIMSLCGKSDVKTAVIYGGVEYEAQIEKIKSGVDFVVGTPGRLIDLYKNHLINFRHVKAIVFDEADRMFDMGFKDDMVYILQRVPQERQILLFSATLNFDVLNTIYRFGANPVEINISRDQVKAGEVKDEIFHAGENEKPQYLLSLIQRQKPRQTIIFSNFKNNVDRITRFLNSNGVPTVGISSLLTQNQRERVLEQFKNENERNTLVATDVAARGLDVKGVDLVINYDLPDDAENYVHRVGRTGRAGALGTAFSLVSDRDVMALSRIEGYLKQKINIGWIEDSDLVKDFKPLPHDNFRGESRVKKTGLAAMKSQIPSGNDGGQRGGGQRRDPRRRQDRHPKHGQRHEQRPRHGQAQGSNGAQSSGQEGAHRDRKLGRHQNQQQSANGNDGHQQQNKHQHKHPQKRHQQHGKPHQQHPHKKSFRQHGGGKTRPQHAQADGKLSQKIKNFFKGLFR
jgi:ATP-dependent RNA helicase RhlB